MAHAGRKGAQTTMGFHRDAGEKGGDEDPFTEHLVSPPKPFQHGRTNTLRPYFQRDIPTPPVSFYPPQFVLKERNVPRQVAGEENPPCRTGTARRMVACPGPLQRSPAVSPLRNGGSARQAPRQCSGATRSLPRAPDTRTGRRTWSRAAPVTPRCAPAGGLDPTPKPYTLHSALHTLNPEPKTEN